MAAVGREVQGEAGGVGAEDRDARDVMIADLAARTGAALVQRIGNIAVLYRQSKDKRQIVLPRA